MAQVRETIDLLTKVLRTNGTSKVKAEIFRLAKFNKNEAVLPLWKLLFELLYFLEYGIIDEVAIRACNALTAGELVVYVKRTMQQKGFYWLDFSNLPNDMSEGSRELLLAVAWLLCSENTVDKFMECCASPLEEEFPQTQRHVSVERPASSVSGLSGVEKVKHLQLLNGKLHHSLKRLYGLQRERTRIQHKVHESTPAVCTSPGKAHLSVLEVHLLRHPEYLKKILKLLEKDNIRLQNLLQWNTQEDIFWKWMQSVLDLKKEERGGEGGLGHDSGVFTHYNIPVDRVAHVTQMRRRLEAAILRYEPVINQLEEIWETKRMEIDESDLDSLLSAIDLELSMHQRQIQVQPSEKTPGKLHNLSEPRMQFIKCSNKNPTNTRRPDLSAVTSTTSCAVEELSDLQTEISRLESHLNRLDVETKRRERKYREELDEIASGIPDSICIMPSSLK